MRRLRTLALIGLALLVVAVPTAAAFDVDPTPPPDGYVGKAYTWRFNAVGGCAPYKFWINSGSLPTGLALSDEGILSGTPKEPGEWEFWIHGESCPPRSAPSDQRFRLRILQRIVVNNATPLPSGTLNQPYGPVQLTATGGTAASWSLSSGALPAGVSLSPQGAIAGTPTASGTFRFGAKVTASDGQTDTGTFTLVIDAPLALGGPTGAVPPNGTASLSYKVGSTVSWAVKATGGKTPYQYSSTPLPPGLVLDKTTGAVTGVAGKAVSKLPVKFTVTDGAGTTNSLTVTFTVRALLAFSPFAAPGLGRVGVPYGWKVPVKGISKGPRTFLASGSFPPGLSLNELTGAFTGTPLKPGAYRVKVWVLDTAGAVISQSFTFKVTP